MVSEPIEVCLSLVGERAHCGAGRALGSVAVIPPRCGEPPVGEGKTLVVKGG